MYKLDTHTQVNINTEIQAMADYLSTRWDNVPDLVALFSEIQKQAAHAARFWFDDFPIFENLQGRRHRRETLLKGLKLPKADKDLLVWYDQSCQLMDQLVYASRKLKDIGTNIDGPWYFEDRAKAVYVRMLEQFEALDKARPKGWTKVQRNDDYGLENYAETVQQSDDSAFRGADVAQGGGNAFACQTSLPHTAYDHFEQNRKAPYVLVYAAYGHFLAIQKHENTRAALLEIETTALRDSEPQPIFDLTGATTNPLVAAMFLLCGAIYTKEDFESERGKKKLSKVEQNALAEETLKDIQPLLDDLAKAVSGSPARTPRVKSQEELDYEAEETRKEAACRTFLLDLVL